MVSDEDEGGGEEEGPEARGEGELRCLIDDAIVKRFCAKTLKIAQETLNIICGALKGVYPPIYHDIYQLQP